VGGILTNLDLQFMYVRGQHFPDNDVVLAAVRKWLASAGADFYERGIQALVHRWQKCITNGGDYVKKYLQVAEILLYLTVLLFFLYLL
jgi:hypothetical protein